VRGGRPYTPPKNAFKAGDLVQVVGTHQEDMPSARIGIITEKVISFHPHDGGSFWLVLFTNGLTLRIWEGHLTHVASPSSTLDTPLTSST
jgi:hypothetical protein